MALSSVGSRGTASAKVAGGTLTMNPSASVAAGDFLVLALAWDNNNGATATGPLGEQLWAEDNAGNTYVLIAEAQLPGGAPSAGAHVGLLIAIMRTALTTSSVITAGSNVNTGLVAKAMSAWQFTSDLPGWSKRSIAFSNLAASDPASLSLSSLESREYLFLHAMAAEGPNTDAYTWDSDYTQFSTAGTTGGVDASNMHIRAGWRIATLTGDTVDVTSNTADRDHSQVYVALYEYQPQQFPDEGIGVLDDFNRADEYPLTGGGNWETSPTSKPTSDANWPGVDTNEVSNPFSNFTVGSYWGQSFIGINDCDAFATLTAGTAVADSVAVFVAGQGTGAGWDGYELRWAADNIRDKLELFTINDDNPSPIHFHGIRNQTIDEKFGVQRRDNEIAAWVDDGSGWFFIGAAYDTFITVGGKIGLRIRDQEGRLDDFGGGGYPRGQIIRRLLG